MPKLFLPGLIMHYLEQSPELMALLGEEGISTLLPPDPLEGPHISVRAVSQSGVENVRRTIIQVTPFAPCGEVLARRGIFTHPDVLVDDLAVMASDILSQAKNVVVDEHTAFSVKFLDAPGQLVDTGRGVDRPIVSAPLRFLVVMHRKKLSVPLFTPPAGGFVV